MRQDFRAAVNKGTRSDSGRIVPDNFELLTEIWGGLPATTSLSFGIDGDTVTISFRPKTGELNLRGRDNNNWGN